MHLSLCTTSDMGLFPRRGPQRRLTLLGRVSLLILGEIAVNAAVWVAAGLCFRVDAVLGLALLAWTIGLRHGLDADHISAIDNATRHLISLGQLPITCGLFFSLGHSTIVIAVNIAIAISVDIYDKLDRVGSVGGIIGASVSSSFLFLIACINTYFLVQAIKARRRLARSSQEPECNVEDPAREPTAIHGGGCLVRILGPLLRAVDRPWKMYPVGVLFGLGFDTASSIALLAISAVAQRGSNGQSISHGKIVILPFLFTAGMTLVDSLDSVLMLYAYATPELGSDMLKMAFFVDAAQATSCPGQEDETTASAVFPMDSVDAAPVDTKSILPVVDALSSNRDPEPASSGDEARDNDNAARPSFATQKAKTISSLSIILTVLSILVALSISLIQIMGLIGENCSPCRTAAEDSDGGGLAGSWWRAWAKANDQSGYIGAGIVGAFAVILGSWYLIQWAKRRSHLAKDRPAQQSLR